MPDLTSRKYGTTASPVGLTAAILLDAFEAHERRQYALSIPTFLAQADGIMTDLLGVQLFSKERGSSRPRTSKALESHLDLHTVRGIRLKSGDIETIMLEPIRHLTGLSQHTDDRRRQRSANQRVSPLNRHGVLHGYDTDYPTEPNSLRALLILEMLDGVRSALEWRRELFEKIKAWRHISGN